MAADREALARRYSGLGSSDLIRIVGVDSRSHEPEALEVALEELRHRGLSQEPVGESPGSPAAGSPAAGSPAAGSPGRRLAALKEPASGSLSRGAKAICLLCLPGLIVGPWLWVHGRRRAARAAGRWSFYGLLLWLSIGVTLRLLGVV